MVMVMDGDVMVLVMMTNMLTCSVFSIIDNVCSDKKSEMVAFKLEPHHCLEATILHSFLSVTPYFSCLY